MAQRLFSIVSVVAILLLSASLNAAGPTLKINKTNFAPGEKITVTFNAPARYEPNAWVGIVPSSVKHGSESVNDQHDITYQYLKNRASGRLTFTAPAQSGSWDIRMNDSDSNGKEVASVSFTVEAGAKVAAGPATLSLKKTSFKPGETISVQFSAPTGYPSNAWVGIIPSNITHGSESVNDEHDVTYQHLNNRTNGTLTFKAPASGNWDVRMSDSDNDGKEVASVSFTVK